MNIDATPTPRLHRSSLAIGLCLGTLLTGITVAALMTIRRPRTPPPLPAFAVTKQDVRLRPGAQAPMRFETAAVQDGHPLSRVPVAARVAAVETRTAPSLAPLEGRVDRVVVSLGDHVEQGARLLRVRSGDLATMLRELRADLASARTKRTLAERMKILVDSRAASENDLLVAQNEQHEAELAARAADSRLKSLAVAEEGDNLYWVLAMRPGIIIQLDAMPGQYVGPNREKPVATVADLDEVRALADVPQQDAQGLAAGQAAQIRFPGSSSASVAGTIETVSEVVDPERQTVLVRVRALNPAHVLHPNAFVEVIFAPVGDKKVFLVPTEAVVSDGLRAVVFVETAAGVYTRREVVIGRQNDGQTEVLTGLRVGERVVSRGALLLLNAIDLEG